MTTNTRTGYYDWGSVHQTTDERICRAQVDLYYATEALNQADPDSATYSVVQARYERAQRRLAELEAES